MYKNELDNAIRNGKISNSFVFFGESIYLIDMYLKMLTNIEDSSELTFYHDEYNFSTAKAHLSQASLFGDRNILTIKNQKKIPKKELDILIQLCEKNSDNVFAYAYYGNDHKTYNNKKAFAKYSTMAVRFFNPKEHEAQALVMRVANEKGVRIDKYTLSHLLNVHNGDVALSCNEMEKLRVYDREITSKDIDNLVYGLAEISIDDFIKKLLAKKTFSHDLQNLLEHGEDEIQILTAVTSFIT
jgi:DNA polymerase-3 subunit delta